MQVDNASAFDKVRWDFLQEVLAALGFPEEIRALVGVLYRDVKFRVKGSVPSCGRLQSVGK